MSGYRVEITDKREVALDMGLVASWFCGLSDEQQADFFVAVTDRAKSFVNGQDGQWWLGHCDCATDEAREMVRNLQHGINYGRARAMAQAEARS